MAIYRTISLTFWTDTKIADDFTPEDKYFYLYLLTNTHTNLCGCYEVSIRQMVNEIGYNKDKIEKLVKRFKNVHRVIDYSNESKELLLINWHKYNWTKSPKFLKSLTIEINGVKDEKFKDYLKRLLEGGDTGYGIDTVSIPYQYGMDTNCMDTSVTVPVTVSDTVTDTVTDIVTDNVYEEIISYLNSKTGRRFDSNTKSYQQAINGRLKEGYTVDDFKYVIDVKVAEWKGDQKMEQYLRPVTLFSPSHFDQYLNQRIITQKDAEQDEIERWMKKFE